MRVVPSRAEISRSVEGSASAQLESMVSASANLIPYRRKTNWKAKSGPDLGERLNAEAERLLAGIDEVTATYSGRSPMAWSAACPTRLTTPSRLTRGVSASPQRWILTIFCFERMSS